MLFFFLSAGTAAAQEGLILTEFQAQNASTLRDAENEFPDWVELYNAGDTAIELEGYHLTDSADDFTQWTFPAVTLEPREFLVVFASGKDRRDPAGELHTNFRLDRDGENLLLVTPDATQVVGGFIRFPEQVADATYGVAMDALVQLAVGRDAPLRYHVPSDGALGLDWTAAEFNDSSWAAGNLAAGFGVRGDEADLLGVDLEAVMRDVNASAYLRIPFEIQDPAAIDLLTLRVLFDDGFVAFINGRLVVSQNVEGDLTWNSESSRSHSPREFEPFDLTDTVDVLRPGPNVLAVQMLNSSAAGSDAIFTCELEAIDVRGVLPSEERYFAEPTPGRPNARGFTAIAPAPEFSSGGGLFTEPQTIVLSSAVEGGVIRYTLDGSVPDESAEEFTEPIGVDGTVVLTARVFHPEMLPGLTASETFVLLDPRLQESDSNLPIAIALTFGRQVPASCEGAYTPGHFILIEPGEDGRTRLTDAPSFSHVVAFRRRGSSTCGRQKFSFNVETRNAESEEEDTVIFGWPAHADYAMYGPENFDRALMRNPLVYELSNDVGQYAVRTRFVECYLHMRPGPITQASFWGLYVFMERNKIGEGRVEIERAEPQHSAEPEVSGGYLFKVDRNDGVPTVPLGGLTVVPAQPKTLTGPQRQWLTTWFNQMRVSLNPETILDRDGEYVDVRSWIDHHILNLLPLNVDAFRLSGYLFKPREGPLHMGPVWDYDRSMGSTDGRDINPVAWDNAGGSSFFAFGWYSPLFRGQPPIRGATAFERAYVNRWAELRAGPLSTEHMNAVIDRMADELREAADRNFARWPGVRPRSGPPPLDGTFQGEVNHLKNWLSRRAEWIDGNFVPTPAFDPPSALVEAGAQVEIVRPAGAQVYYTLDGTDPRLENGNLSGSAILYEGPIVIERSTRIVARVLQRSSLWSAAVEAVYVLSIPRLAITEFMYNPLAPTPEEEGENRYTSTDMEFIEIQNIGDEPAEVFGIHFGRSVSFEFDQQSDLTTLAPGEVAVIVSNLEAFGARYDLTGINVAGVYGGSMSNTGEDLTLLAATDDEIFTVSYVDDWYPQTDGQGHSLEHVDVSDGTLDTDLATTWRPSPVLHGTPGAHGAPPAAGRRQPGDLNGDSRLNILDAIGYFVLGTRGSTLPCGDGSIDAPGNVALLDSNGDERVDLADALFTLNYLFQSGPPSPRGTACTPMVDCDDACGG